MEGAHRVQPEIQSRDDAEVAAAATDRPEQIFVLARPEFQHLAIGSHELRADDVVARCPEEAAPGGIAAGERQTSHADRPAAAHRRDEPERERRGEQLANRRSAANGGDSAVRIDADGVERAEINLQRAIGDAESGVAVTAAADGDRDVMSPRDLYAAPHVVEVCAPRHGDWATVVGEVPDLPRLVEEGRPGLQETPADVSGEIGEIGIGPSRQGDTRSAGGCAGSQRHGTGRGEAGANEVASGPGRKCPAVDGHRRLWNSGPSRLVPVVPYVACRARGEGVLSSVHLIHHGWRR